MEVKKEIIEQRFEDVRSGVFNPQIKGFDNLIFMKLSGKERAKASRVYCRALRKLHEEGGLYSEALLPEVIKRLCDEQGVDYKCIEKARKLYEKAYKKLPIDLKNINKLSEEEILNLSDEEQAKIMKEVEEKTKALTLYWENAFTKKEKCILNEAQKVDELTQQLQNSTYEHFARKQQIKYEIFLSSRKDDNENERYFNNENDIEELDAQVQVALYKKYLKFRNGAENNFLSQ